MLSITLALLATAPLSSVDLGDFPFVRQKPDFCGEADVSMAMRKWGHDVTQDQVFALAGIDPAKGRGAVTNELAAALRALGVEPGPVWYHPKDRAGVDAQFTALHDDLAAGQPSIVCMHYSDEPQTTEHFRLVTGYDADNDEIIYQEPAEDHGENRRMKRALFLKLWTFKPAKDRNTIIRFRMPKPAAAPAIPAEASPTRADVVQHVMEMDLPKGMTLVWEKPFLVVGDEPAAEVRSRAQRYVAWTRDLLLKDFFDEAPTKLQEVWILKDDASYRKISKKRFHRDPDTPYGYYLAGPRALIMNIKPGYGTLTHELVHPFFEHAWGDSRPSVAEPNAHDTRSAPAWMNEGVASLFERPAERDGHMIGKVNWRLPALLGGFQEETVPSFTELVHMSDDAFYEDERGLNYAEARYLCYWLQERGLLAKVVRRAHELKDVDPTGWKALTEVLGTDPDALFSEWRAFTKALRNT